MKAKAFQLVFNNPKALTNRSQKFIQRQIHHTSASLDSFKNSSFLSTQSSNRLKHHSIKNKDERKNIIHERLSILNKQLNSFCGNNSKIQIKVSHSHRNNSLNINAKEYNPLYQIKRIRNDHLKSIQKKQSIEEDKVRRMNKNIQSFQFQDNKIHNPDFQKQNLIKQNDQFCLQKLSTYQDKLILVQEQRLKRHRFNKSSIQKTICAETINHDIKCFDQSVVKVFGNCQQSINFQRSKTISPVFSQQGFQSIENNEYIQARKIKTAKRYVAFRRDIKNDDRQINPYTRKKYLHLKIEDDYFKFKIIQKLQDQTFCGNMQFRVDSVQVKALNPSLNFMKTNRQKRNHQAEEFLKKVKRLGNAQIRNTRKTRSNKQKYITQHQPKIQGWKIDCKELINSNRQQIFNATRG